MFACLLSVCLCGAPVPGKHAGALSPPPAVPNGPAVVGFRWWYGTTEGYELEVVEVEETVGGVNVIYRCVSHPGKQWGAIAGRDGLSRQSIATTWSEVNAYEQGRGRAERDKFLPFTLTPGDE